MFGAEADPSEVEQVRSELESTRLHFSGDGAVTRTPLSPWDQARWERNGDVVTLTADRVGDTGGPIKFPYRLSGDLLIDLTNKELTLHRVE